MGSFIPPINFSWVEEDLYRSGVPNELNYPFLEKLNLRKVLYLSPDELPPQFLNFLDDHDIELVPVGWDSDQTPWMPIPEEVVLAALRMANEKLNTQIQEAIKNAEDAAKKYGKASKEAKVAWDFVEELEAERSHQAANKQSEDPLEKYCNEVPEADECRVYED